MDVLYPLTNEENMTRAMMDDVQRKENRLDVE